MKCQTCGNDNPADAQFCGGCGASLEYQNRKRENQHTLGATTASGIGAASSELPMVSFIDTIKLGFRNYFAFSGRATRAEAWWWVLFTILASIVLEVVDTLISTIGIVGDSDPLGQLFRLAVLIPSFALGARRLHDINRTAWWLLLWVVLIIGWIVLIVWAIKRGDEGQNNYDPDQRQSTSQQPYKP